MAEINRNRELISKEERNNLIQGFIDYYETDKGEKIGVIAAGDILDHFLQTVGILLYNKGVSDSVDLIRERFDTLAMDMELLQRE